MDGYGGEAWFKGQLEHQRRDADLLIALVHGARVVMQRLGLDLAAIELKTRGDARSRIYGMLEAHDIYTRSIMPRVQDPDVICEIQGVKIKESWKGDNGWILEDRADEGPGEAQADDQEGEHGGGPAPGGEAEGAAGGAGGAEPGGGERPEGAGQAGGRDRAPRTKSVALIPPADPAEQQARFQARMTVKRREVTERERAQRRREEEQAEARALGVKIVDKINIDMTWSEQEHDVLRILYPDYRLMQSKLPHRSHDAIRFQVKRLGLTGERSKQKPWTGAEIKTLKSVYTTLSKKEVMAALPGRNWRQIKGQAGQQRLSRPKLGYLSTGIAILDEIRDRAFKLKVSMRDLDVMAETGAYFSDRGWAHRHGPSMNKFAKAVEALSGVLVVEWQEV